jgi:hypothetical protein
VGDPSAGKGKPFGSLLIVVVLDSRLSPAQSGLNLNTEFETTDFITPKDFGAVVYPCLRFSAYAALRLLCRISLSTKGRMPP